MLIGHDGEAQLTGNSSISISRMAACSRFEDRCERVSMPGDHSLATQVAILPPGDDRTSLTRAPPIVFCRNQ